MYIEDNTKLAQTVLKGLKREGFAVDHFENGEEAADRLFVDADMYDAVILDLMLPGRSGQDITMSIRDRQIMVPIIIVTALSDMAHKLTLLNAGADDYLVKPFSFEELVARVRALIRRPSNITPTDLYLGDLRLNASNRKVFYTEQPIKLTSKEFSILELFMHNQDTVLSREYILDHVWDYNFSTGSNVVDVHVKNLRKKLEAATGKTFIETVTGQGYRIEA